MRVLVLLTDGFGGHGGIAKFNRDLLATLCSLPEVAQVVAIPRLMPELPPPLPHKLSWVTDGLGGKRQYVATVLKCLFLHRQTGSRSMRSGFDLLICGHLNLLPIAAMAKMFTRGTLIQFIHGIEAWQRPKSRLAGLCLRRVDAFVSVSELSRERFFSWAKLDKKQSFVLPNAVDLARFTPGLKEPHLLTRYGLRDRTVIMTLARLSPTERYKGIDEVMEIMPSLLTEIPNLSYLVCGDGGDLLRLRQKAVKLGLKDRVVFAGRIDEAEKKEHYRLADAFVMPGWGEGFGIVYLEAMACGIPVVASKADASREVVRNGELGVLVDPNNPLEVREGILTALRQPKGTAPQGLEFFSCANYHRRCASIITEMCL